jgi:DNA (cytosine-5)-methyltransferase 1
VRNYNKSENNFNDEFEKISTFPNIKNNLVINSFPLKKNNIRVFDFFSGAGGASCGFRNAGLEIVLGVDKDPDSKTTFLTNFPEAKFIQENISVLTPESISHIVNEMSGPRLFCGCAPCQPFSRQNKNKSLADDRMKLLERFGDFVRFFVPEYVFIENVPGLQNMEVAQSGPLGNFLNLLKSLKYFFKCDVIRSCDYGVPQRRARLVLMASTLAPVRFPKPNFGIRRTYPYRTVADLMAGLPLLSAGKCDPVDRDHCSAPLSEKNLARLRATPPGGSHKDWPNELKLACHLRHDGHTDAYGRLSWDKMAGALTTKCISLSNGRFGHPDQDRALSVREAALLQTFPLDWNFSGTLWTKARQVGNAVPPILAFRFGKMILAHYHKYRL